MKFNDVIDIVFVIAFLCLAGIGVYHMIFINWFEGLVVWVLSMISINQKINQRITQISGGANNG